MTPEDITLVRQCLPDTQPFPYYAYRESAWLMQTLLAEDTPVRTLRQSGVARLLDRPLIKPLTALGGGVIRRADLQSLAHADRVTQFDMLSPAALAGLEQVYDLPWLDFEISFTDWGAEDWQWQQLSRPGGNLVLQLGFPSDHAVLLSRHHALPERAKFECWDHPVRRQGRPTLAWARLDIDPSSGTALIEELQSDWLRFVRAELRRMRARRARSHRLQATQAYEAALSERYGKVWPRALLLAVLVLLKDQLGCTEIYLHQPDPGAKLKWITGPKPPVSLYSALPRSFCFQPTREIPEFLRRKRRKHLRQLPRDKPLFWRLNL